ncbi:MAG: cytochrome c3 family protein, partial [Rudaea sp.]|nr:cytochrome c3 family protein [Rudaea sp.]
KVHDLPDFVYFNHSIHVNKGIGCASCHGRVDEMPLMYMQNSLQMEWCLDCHRNPAKNLRPTSEIYNMAWEGPSGGKNVQCAPTGKGAAGSGTTTAQSINCTVVAAKPEGSVETVAMETAPAGARTFTSQMELGKYLTEQYHIRPPNELTSCETCHR